MGNKKGITNVKHIKSVEIPVEENKKYKFIYVVTSCDDRIHARDDKLYGNDSRPWSFWETQESAIEHGIFSWSDAESLYECGYYTHIVVEKIPLNHVMPSMEQIEDDSRVWFKFVPEEANKREHDIRKAIVPCECPEYFKNVIGFF